MEERLVGELTPDARVLGQLRAIFLAAEASPRAVPDYWCVPGAIEQYDAFLAPRIGQKWRAVVEELRTRGWGLPTGAVVVDWACGTGIAAREFGRGFSPSTVRFSDRSPAATAFAARRYRAEFPGIDVGEGEIAPSADRPTVLLVSHVLNEFNAHVPAELEALAARAHTVIWLEPGTPFHFAKLAAWRERWRAQRAIWAPCPHAGRCGLLDRPTDWCHHFAPPAPSFFTERKWAAVQRILHLDLRSLPVSYLVFSREAPPAGERGARVIGAPRFLKREVRAQICRPDGAIEDVVASSDKHFEKRVPRYALVRDWPLRDGRGE